MRINTVLTNPVTEGNVGERCSLGPWFQFGVLNVLYIIQLNNRWSNPQSHCIFFIVTILGQCRILDHGAAASHCVPEQRLTRVAGFKIIWSSLLRQLLSNSPLSHAVQLTVSVEITCTTYSTLTADGGSCKGCVTNHLYACISEQCAASLGLKKTVPLGKWCNDGVRYIGREESSCCSVFLV